jgi:hypothetical protein
MKKSIKTLLIASLSILLLSFMAMPNNGNWVKLGTKKVDMHADHDEILVTAQEGVFTKLKFKILKAPLLVHNVRVVFGNGESKNIVFDKKFPPGTESRVIDLPGNKRIIKKIKMNYKTPKNANGKAIVLVLGKH